MHGICDTIATSEVRSLVLCAPLCVCVFAHACTAWRARSAMINVLCQDPATPMELRKMGKEAHGSPFDAHENKKENKHRNYVFHFNVTPLWGKSLNSVLYDAWAACGEGIWSKSSFLMKIRERHSTKRRGVRRWLLYSELVSRFGEDLTVQLTNRKLLDKELRETEVRFHPEFPNSEDWLLLCHLLFKKTRSKSFSSNE